MAASEHEETERKYDVDGSIPLPRLDTLDGVTAVAQAVTQDLEAQYFDTSNLDLSRHGVTLRRRTGGEDAGWHLKLPARGDTRTEVRLPLGPGHEEVPAGLLAPVRAIVRDRSLRPVAGVRTRRLAYDLLDDEGRRLAQVCDDTVTAERHAVESAVQHWREWEVELADGPDTLLDAVEEALLDAGAVRATSRSKLARTLGEAVPAPRDKPSPEQLASGAAADVLLAHQAEHIAHLWEQDARVRADQPGSIHKLRIAARRLRSALTTYRPLLLEESSEPLRDELRWLGQTLGAARDAEVLRERLDDLVAAQPAELVMGPVAARIDRELASAYQAGREETLAVLDGERYFRLLDALDAMCESPPLAPGADHPASEVLPRLLARDTRRLRRAVAAAKHSESADQRDPALHEARKKAKRLRYAADSTVPVFGNRAEELSAAAKRVQQALGLHQDAVVARRKLREFAVQAYLDGDNGFTFGRMHALEERRAEDAERAFRKAWKKVPRTKVRRWITA